MKNLATIEKIHSISVHPNPEVERLEVAKIKEWPVVIKKGEFQEGQLVVFITIDTIVPSTNPFFSFLERQKYRIWNSRFKGAPSQGLVCSLSVVPKPDGGDKPCSEEWIFIEGMDVTEELGIVKYEKPEPICSEAVGFFPTNLIPVTDEENLLKYGEDILKELRGKECYITGKADGSSCTIIYQDGKVRVCSRKLEQKEGTGFWTIVNKLGLVQKLIRRNFNVAIQAEAVGPSIQSNRMGLSEKTFRVFSVRNLNNGEWYSWNYIKAICADLDLTPVEQIGDTFVLDNNWNVTKLQEIANSYKYGQQNGEGIVLRPVTPEYSPTLNRQLSVKILNVDYKQ